MKTYLLIYNISNYLKSYIKERIISVEKIESNDNRRYQEKL